MARRPLSPWFALAVPLALAVGACSEDLETGSTCPALCPGQQLVVIDTVIEPGYAFDTTLVGFPTIGLEFPMLLAARGDTLDVRAVVRFDTVPRLYRPTPSDTLRPIVNIDSAWMEFRLRPDGLDAPTQFFVDAYDVFAPGLEDTVPTSVLPYFVPERLLGSYVGNEQLTDSLRVRIPLDTARLLAILSDTARRLRIGLQVRSTESVQLSMNPFEFDGDGPTMNFWVSPDSFVGNFLGVDPYSDSPESPFVVAEDLNDYSVVVAAPSIVAPERLVVGGLPASRGYIRFELPTWLTDSVGILRAQLEFVQDPIVGIGDSDTLTINTHLVLATAVVDNPRRAATLLAPGDQFTRALRLVPRDSGLVVLELNRLLRLWGTDDAVASIPRVIVLRSQSESATPGGIRFFGLGAADPTLRPRLRISYTPEQVFGRP